MSRDCSSNPQKLHIQGVILAGGQSRRMGTSKALLPVPGKGQPLLRLIVDSLYPACDGVTVVTAAEASPEERESLAIAAGNRVQMVSDRYAGSGPLAGIHASLSSLPAHIDWAFVMACDMPIFSKTIFTEMVGHLAQPAEDLQLVCCPHQPFHALYHRSAALAAENALLSGQLRLQAFMNCLNQKLVIASDPSCFINLNTPDDYYRYFGE
jgi:molybdenum cofactor guanylyltransferase